MKRMEDHNGDTWKVRVVPRDSRDRVLKPVLDRGGHLGSRKVKASLQKHFTRPRCGRDVAAYVVSCSVCQKVGKIW